MVTFDDVGDNLTDFLDGAGAFVSEHAGSPRGNRPVLGREIGVADSAGNQLDADLFGPDLGQFDIVADFEVLVEFRENCGFHEDSLQGGAGILPTGEDRSG